MSLPDNASGLFAIDFDAVNKPVIKALESGRGVIMNGVARDTKNGLKILQHMPFRPVEMDTAGDLARAAAPLQRLSGGATAACQTALAISTAVTVGSVIVSTAYLSHQLERLEGRIERLQANLTGQNLLFYASRASSYFGAVNALRELISNPELMVENPDLVVYQLARLSARRHEMQSFAGQLFHLFDSLPDEHLGPALDFFHGMMDFFPKAVFVECQAAYRMERLHLGLQTLQSARESYYYAIDSYREWGNDALKGMIEGRPRPSTTNLALRLDDARALVRSETNRLLLNHSV